MNQQIKERIIFHLLMSAVSNSIKDDLAGNARVEFYLTYLKRRNYICRRQVSQGTSLDVAIIQRRLAFVWIKRKHTFRPELNQHFFDNYFQT